MAMSLVVSALAAAQPVFVDTRLLLLVHPLFADFDSATGRFKNTSSEYVSGGQQGVDDLLAEIQKQKQWLLNSPKALQERLREVPLPDRLAAERAFLAEKRAVEQRVAVMQMRAYMARLVPGRPGVTPDSSIYPQINQITSDIRAVLEKIKDKHGTSQVIDVAELLPVVSFADMEPVLLGRNLHTRLWNGEKTAPDEDFAAWLAEADEYWAARLGMNADIIPLGATDVRLEAIKLMEDQVKGQKK